MFPGLRLFRKSEQSHVAKVLGQLRKFGYRTFPNPRPDSDNIDHVIVGPAGVFAIATKYRSSRGENESRNSENLALRPAQGVEPAEKVGGKDLDGDGPPEEKYCLKQERKNAIEVDQIIKENCEFDGWVWPLVVFAGKWPVRNDQTTNARLFTTDKLMNYILSQQPRLTPSEITLIASQLERSARGK
jgi:hypothetical protein